MALNIYELDLLNEVLNIVLNPRATKLWAIKVGFEKKYETFWIRGYIFESLYSESLLFGRPGFDPRTLQTLRAYNFAAPWSTRLQTSYFEIFDLYLIV